jgi:hypothetical protein
LGRVNRQYRRARQVDECNAAPDRGEAAAQIKIAPNGEVTSVSWRHNPPPRRPSRQLRLVSLAS